MPSQIHVISKQNVSNHATVTVDDDLPVLAPGCVRARMKITTLTVNNYTQALTGGELPWWDAYPVPATLPEAYNDPSKWGIVPCWGYAEVLQSNIGDVPETTVLWGYWPTSSYPFDLKLEPIEGCPGHYWEVSDERKTLFSLNNHIEVVAQLPSKEVQAQIVGLYIFYTAAFILNKYCFPIKGSGPAIAPFPTEQWTEEDADLTQAVVIILNASSKTALATTRELAHRGLGDGPLGLLHVTSPSTSVLPPRSQAAFKYKAVTYEALLEPSTREWIAGLQPRRIVAMDFGAAPGVAEKLQNFVVDSEALNLPLLYLLIGGNYAMSLGHPQARKALYSTSHVKYPAGERVGIAELTQEMQAGFREYMNENAAGDMGYSWEGGIGGEKGIEGYWDALGSQTFPKRKCLIFTT